MTPHQLPIRMVAQLDCEALIAQLQQAPVMVDPEQYPELKVLVAYMRRHPLRFKTLRPSLKTLTVVSPDGTERKLIKCSLVDTPVRAYE